MDADPPCLVLGVVWVVGVARMSHAHRTGPADAPYQPDDTDDDRSARHEVRRRAAHILHSMQARRLSAKPISNADLRRLALERVPPADYPVPDATGQGRAGMLT